jgi:hypothetical protein
LSLSHVIAASAALLVGGVSTLSAQGHLVKTGGLATAGVATVSPRSGAVGAVFKLATKGLPPNTQVQIMLGAIQTGFEVLETLQTDDQGRLQGQDSVNLKVPAWVQNDRAYLVMLTDVDYNPLAAADMFHPTDQNSVVKRKGLVSLEDPSCPMLTSEAGEIYFLVGDTNVLRANGPLLIEGPIVAHGRCGQTTTIQVKSVKAAG